MNENKLHKFVNFAIVILPLFQCYNFFGINAGKILMFLYFLFLLVFGKKKKYLPKPLKLFLIYAFTIPQFVAILLGYTSNFVGSYITLTLYILCLCFSIPYINICLFKKYYSVVIVIAIGVFTLQEISALLTGARFSALIPFLTLYNGVPASQFASVIANESRSCSLFVEPSHFAQYLAPFLAISLCELSKKNKLFDGMSVIVSMVLLLLRSGNGLLMLAFIWMLHLLFVDIKWSKKIFIVIPLVFVGLLYTLPRLAESEQGQEILERQKTMEMDYSGESRSATIRIYRGFFVYGDAPAVVKILGVGLGGADDVIDKSSYNWMFFKEHYLNNASGLLISYGVLGTILFLLFLFSFRIKKEKGTNLALWGFIILCFMESFMFDTRMLLYLCAIYACSLVNGSDTKRITN